MKELRYFKETGIPEINVALAGVCKMDWEFTNSTEPSHAAQEKMKANCFDILPTVESDGTIVKYFKTNQWGNYDTSNINLHNINHDDRIYYLTHIHDAIIKFAISGRNFFFLDNQSEIIGLITIGNLNCKHVYLYLYHLIIELEQKLSDFITHNGISDKELIEIFENRVSSCNAKDALKRYKEDNQNGYDYKFLEYVYLMDLVYIYKFKKLTKLLDLSNTAFEKHIKDINKIRSIVAHPNKSLIRTQNSILDLRDAILAIDMILSKIKKVQNPY